MVFRFFILFSILLSTTVYASVDLFKQNIEALLQGKKQVEISSALGEDLCVTIAKKKSAKKTFYDVSFTLEDEHNEEGAFLVIFPTKDQGHLGYLKWLHKIPNKYSGTKLLQALDLFCKEMKLSKVFLIDASEIEADKEDQSESSFSLRRFHILTNPDHTSWYESRGYDPISKKTTLQWIRWITREKESSFLYVRPISKKIYREAALRFAAVECERYLGALDSFHPEIDAFTEHSKRLRAMLENLSFYGSSSTFAEVIQKLGSIDRQKQLSFMSELDEFLASDEQIEQFLTLLFNRHSPASADASYATFLLIQSLFRDGYNFQTLKDRKNLFKHVVSFFQGRPFVYERDTSSFRYMLSDEEIEKMDSDDFEESNDSDGRELIERALKYLGKTNMQLLLDYADDKSKEVMRDVLKSARLSSKLTVSQVAKKLKGKTKTLFLEQVLFGTNSFYRDVSIFIDKLQSSSNGKEFLLGYLLNYTLLEQASFLEHDFAGA